MPAKIHICRARITHGSFIRKAATVVRPWAVNPKICRPSELQAKCSAQICVLG